MSDKREPSANISYWLPRLLNSGVLVPKTILVPTELDLISLCDGELPEGFSLFLDELQKAAEKIGWPIFLRTGYGSGKHDWLRTCYVETPAKLSSHVGALVEWSACVDIWGFPTTTWAVREFLPLESLFTAYRGMPVNRERRYFFHEGHTVCHHPYWPSDAVKLGKPSIENWEVALQELNADCGDDLIALTTLTEQVGRYFDGAWSLDWAKSRGGAWIAIDMAPAALSWHWPRCPASKRLGWRGE